MSIFGSKKKKDRLEEPLILVESWSPVCHIQAFAEDNGECVYFYLWLYPGEPYAEVRSCWVCNKKPGGETLDKAAMDAGIAPMMPKEFVCHDPDGIQLKDGSLDIVWFEEGDGAALVCGEDILAVIPGWSGKNFCGYAKYCTGQGPFAWELAQAHQVLSERVRRSREYWSDMEGDYWEGLQKQLLQALEEFFGQQEKYFAIDGGEFPAMALAAGQKDSVKYGFTLGVSTLAMPQVEQYRREDAQDFRRIEIGFAWEEGALEEQAYMQMFSYISGQVRLPWSQISWLGHGHTIPCDAMAGAPAVLLLSAAEMPELVSPAYGSFRGDRINLLWMVPLTQEEYDLAREMEVEQLLEKAAGDRKRLHIFDGKRKFFSRG